MGVVNQAIKSDCDEQVDIFYVVNRVEGLVLGLYKNGELLKTGDFNSKAGYLCLEQDLGKSSAVTFFLATKSKNYQEAYQKAGIIGHRLYLASNYLDIGCSGIGAYYDDEVCEFIEENTMVLPSCSHTGAISSSGELISLLSFHGLAHLASVLFSVMKRS